MELAPPMCPGCGELRMIEQVAVAVGKIVRREVYHCEVCTKDWCRDVVLERRPTTGCPTCGGRKG